MQRGWFGVASLDELIRATEIRLRHHGVEAVEREIAGKDAMPLRYTIVIPTIRYWDGAVKALRSAVAQHYDPTRFEVILVNNVAETDISRLVTEARHESRTLAPEHIRYVVGPIKGLSHARNFAISEARGEIICFLDDDAIATPDWLRDLDEAYESNERAGVVGGRVLLQLPPRPPDWMSPELYCYWSHLDPGFREIRWAEHWSEFPWGANWTGKRRLLLEVGGFRPTYGRAGRKDLTGGDDQVAAILIHQLGHPVGIVPRGDVHHHVEPRRFTTAQLRKTILAAALANYRMQKDLYVPMWMNVGFELKAIRQLVRTLLRYPKLSRSTRLVSRYRLRAEFMLLRHMLVDAWRRRALPWRTP
jgi:glycosyltransferase involved in cell wall biosynthesis